MKKLSKLKLRDARQLEPNAMRHLVGGYEPTLQPGDIYWVATATNPSGITTHRFDSGNPALIDSWCAFWAAAGWSINIVQRVVPLGSYGGVDIYYC